VHVSDFKGGKPLFKVLSNEPKFTFQQSFTKRTKSTGIQQKKVNGRQNSQ